MLFSDQVSILSTWFKNWNECEQTVALFSLLKRVKKRQAKFLARCLEHGLKDCVELIPVEIEANDAGYIGKLIGERQQDQVINILLSHLPLLQPGNDDAKSRYLELLPQVLAFAVERSEFLQESRQLLSYSLIHPAFDNDERQSLTSWMEHLDDRIPNVVPPAPDESQNGNDVNHNKLWKDDPALSRPETHASLGSPPTQWKSNDNGYARDVNANSLSPTKPRDDPEQGSRHADPVSEDGIPPEYDFNPWLKSLRLHKYKDLFASMNYEEMMALTEEKLTEKKVTKGARDKILLNVKRLHERFDKLQNLEKEIPRGASLHNALNDLKAMIFTPIKRFENPQSDTLQNNTDQAQATNPAMDPANLAPGPMSGQAASAAEIQPGDIPGQYTKVMGKACTQLLISKPDKDNIFLYMQLLERCLQHQAFTPQQKKRLQSWKSQMNKMCRSLPRNQQLSSQRGGPGSSYHIRRVANRGIQSVGARMANPVGSSPLLTSSPLSMFPNQVPKVGWYPGGFGSAQPHGTQADVTRKTASLDHSLVQRMAYPPGHMMEDGWAENVTATSPFADSDISKRLDSLSNSVAEHALADADRISTL